MFYIKFGFAIELTIEITIGTLELGEKNERKATFVTPNGTIAVCWIVRRLPGSLSHFLSPSLSISSLFLTHSLSVCVCVCVCVFIECVRVLYL